MHLPFKIARRYVFSKKSTNAINIISGISVFGICIGSMALIVIMSVFNGFGEVLSTLIGNFKPDVQITAVEGKVFVPNEEKIAQLRALDGVKYVSKTLEEIALFEYDGVQCIGHIKGIDQYYMKTTTLDTCIQTGEYTPYDSLQNVHYGLIGVTLEYTLDISVGQAFNRPITVYMPKRTGRMSTSPTQKPFKKQKLYPSGTFAIRQAGPDSYTITNLAFVQKLTSYKKGEISALELKLEDGADDSGTLSAIKTIMGDEFSVKNRYQQDEALYKITNLEKYVAFLIFALTLVLVAFNMVGALWMLVLEKKKDISTLKSMGATNQLIQQVFLLEGFLLSAIGSFLGCILAIVLCYLQQEYGLVKLSGSGDFVIDAYPVKMHFWDFVQVIITVLVIGTGAAWLPAHRATKIGQILRNE